MNPAVLQINMVYLYTSVFDKNFCLAPNWLQSYMPTAPQSTMMDQLYSISIEGLNHVAPKSSNSYSNVGHLEFPSGQWCTIVAYRISCFILMNGHCLTVQVQYSSDVMYWTAQLAHLYKSTLQCLWN